jgi:hypothetical protein
VGVSSRPRNHNKDDTTPIRKVKMTLTTESSPDLHGLGTTKPEIHCSAGQSPEQVEELLDKNKEIPQVLPQARAVDELPVLRNEDVRKQQIEEIKEDIGFAKKHYSSSSREKEVEAIKSDLRWYENVPGKLSYDGEIDWYSPDIRLRAAKADFDAACNDVCPEWRALAGLCQADSIVEREPVVLEIMESIKALIYQRVPTLTAEWGGDCWNKHLMLNGARTSICGVSIKAAYEGLKGIASEIEAARSVTELVVNRVTSLFAMT